jgi:hypothetical protein
LVKLPKRAGASATAITFWGFFGQIPLNIPVDNPFDGLPGLGRVPFDPASMHCGHQAQQRAIMAKRKKGSKVQRAKLRRANSAKRSKASRVSKAAKATKWTVAKAKPKSAPVKKVARKVKPPVAPAVETVAETVAVEVIEQPVPGVAEVEETRKAS